MVRSAWAALPFGAGPALAAALDGRSAAVQAVGSVGLWAAWAVVLVATLVPHPVGLTVLRAAAAAALAAALWTAGNRGSPLAVGTAAVAVAVTFLPETGALFVNGPAYPNERRFPLRVPGPLLLGVVPVAWALAVGLPVAAALLLAARQWVAGGVLAVAGLPASLVLFRALHGLSRRWVVFVPAGVVLHDPISLTDPVLFRRRLIRSLRPARAGSDSLDLTQGAPGLALELLLGEEVPLVLTQPGNRQGRSHAASRLLFTPTRPGAVLREAAARRIPTG